MESINLDKFLYGIANGLKSINEISHDNFSKPISAKCTLYIDMQGNPCQKINRAGTLEIQFEREFFGSL